MQSNDDRYNELVKKYEALQHEYDELRVTLAQMGITLASLADDERNKRKSRSTAKLTVIKGGLAAIGAWLILRFRRHPAMSAALTACTLTVGGVAMWGSVSQAPNMPALMAPIPAASVPFVRVHHRRRRGSVSPVGRNTPGGSNGASGHGGGAPNGHGSTPSPRGSLRAPNPAPTTPHPGHTSRPQPSPRPSPTPRTTSPQPKPSPTPSKRHCLVYAKILGVRVCVKWS